MTISVFIMRFPAQGICALYTAHNEEGKIIGAVTTLEKGSAVMEFCRLHVAESQRQKGVGRKLITRMEHHARALGYKSISCLVAEKNVVAACFYKALGFTPAYQFPDGDIIYTKPLEEAPNGQAH